jgi:aspartyl-tRNA(Asn)/glutamyl-tRNA(Gln) amidotransferase subunit A
MSNLNIPNLDSIIKTVEKIKNSEVTSLELVQEHIQRAKEINPLINAFITIFEDALDKAKEIDEKIKNGEEVGKLAGIPFTAKDLYLVDGIKTTFGSKFMEDFIAPYTGTVIQKVIDEGAILIAKCNCDPWGFGGSGENSGYGPTKHPLDFERSPGGSSSGSAASLLAGVGFFSLGTDTGGSVRQPASMCGLYGFKPTYGRNSRFGIGTMGSSFDTPGFFTRYLEDVKLLEEIMQGRDEHDPTTFDIDYKNVKIKTGKLKIGVPKEYFGEGLNEEIKAKIFEEIEKYKAQGHEIVDISIPSTKYALSIYYIIVPAEISSNRARYDSVRFGKKISDEYEENLIKSRSMYLEPEVKRRIMVGTYVLSAGYADQFYKKANKVRTKLKKEFEKAFEEVDLIISPTTPTTAFKIGEKTDNPVEMYLADVYTVTANLVGVPSLNIPIGNDKNGLPIGMQIKAKWFDDALIFSFLG